MEIGIAEKLGAHVQNPNEEGAAETVVKSGGEEYRMSFLEQRIKGQLEKWLVGNAVKSIADCESLAESATDQDQKLVYLREADKQRSMFMDKRSAGVYNWMGSVCRQALCDVPGTAQLIYLFLKRCHKDMTEEQAYLAYMGNRKDFNAAVFWALGKEVALVNGQQERA